MKPTQLTELFANIKKTFVSFFSILMFVALGVGIFLGISWAGPALQNAASTSFDEGSFHHFQVQYLYGLTEDDLAELAEVEGVTDIEATRQSFQRIEIPNDSDLTVKVQTLTERIDVPAVVEGELPTKANEMALNVIAANKLGYSVGDTITFLKDASTEDADDPTALLSAESANDDNSTSASSSDDDGMEYLNESTFKVTALVNSPEYLAKSSETYGFSTLPSGSVDMLAWVPAAAFDASAFQNGYPVVDIVCNSLTGLDSFSDDYKQKSADIDTRLSDLGTVLATDRFNDLHGTAQAKIDDGEKQLAEGKQKISDGEKQLVDGRAELETRKAEGEAQLASAYDELMYYEGLKQQGEAQLAEARERVYRGQTALAEVDAAKATITSEVAQARAYSAEQDDLLARGEITQEQHDAALDSYGAALTERLRPYAERVGTTIPDITHENFEIALLAAEVLVDNFEDIPVEFEGTTMTVAEARVKLAEGQQQLANAEAQYYQLAAQLEDGWSQYYAGQDELNRQVAEAEQKLADAEAQIEDAKQQVAQKEPLLDQAKDQLATMKSYRWAVMPRAYNASYAEVITFSDVTTHLSFSMAALFIIVGLLVSYSAVSRIVHEQITQIGTKKALGLYAREITISFLSYSALAVIAGAIIGVIVGIIAVEGIIGHVLGGMFTFGDYPPYFGLVLFLIVTLLELLLVLGATWLACRGILKEHAVELLKGEKPPAAKTRFYEKWKIWDRLPLFTQTIVNNCVNDKRRVFSTVVGVAGCTALIVTAITLNNDVLKSYDRHYENVYNFNAITYVDTAVEGSIDNAQKAFEDKGATATAVSAKSYIMHQPNGDRGTVSVVIPTDAEQFSQVYKVPVVAGEPFDLSARGVWVSQAYAEHTGAKVGDNITYEDADGAMHELPILGFYEFWLTYHEVIMGSDYYESEFGEELEPNVVLANTGDMSVDDFSSPLSNVDGFDSIVDDKIDQHGNFETFSSVSSAVVLIYIALSVLMAIVVLLNLNVMFIEEKKRDLIVLMINGFSVKDAKRYIYNDTIVLTAIGIILGLILGCVMGSITVGAIEPSTASFVKAVDWPSVIIGAVGSALLALIMCVISLRRIPRFDLTDINKF